MYGGLFRLLWQVFELIGYIFTTDHVRSCVKLVFLESELLTLKLEPMLPGLLLIWNSFHYRLLRYPHYHYFRPIETMFSIHLSFH